MVLPRFFLCRDRLLRDTIRLAIKQYLEINDPALTSLATTWDALKAVVRGQCIELATTLKAQQLRERLLLETDLQAAEAAHKAVPSAPAQRKVTALKGKLHAIYSNRAEKTILRLQTNNYTGGNKVGSILARQLRVKQERTYVPLIIDEAGIPHTAEEGKALAFESFYRKLYTSDDPSPQAQQIYLDSITLPRVSPLINDGLVAPITPEEVQKAIDALKPRKAPGPDGYTAHFYRTFAPELVPFLTILFNDIAQTRQVTPSMREALVAIIPKPGKNPTGCSSYRPIALLNIDAKLYSKILASRLESVLPDLIDPDQSGFIKGRQTHDNLRRVVHIIEKAQRKHIPAALLALDAEKAFDRVEWSFLFSTLRKFGFHESFVGMIQANYQHPTSRVLINGTASPPFSLARGTRQGCPLSPLLFALSIEPLAQAIRSNQDISGMRFREDDHKISLFADDVLLPITNPMTTLPAIQEELARFEKISGYKTNLSKSYLLNLTLPSPLWNQIIISSPFSCVTKEIAYLGVQLTPRVSDLYRANFPPLLQRLRTDMSRWDAAYLTWLGRINAIKMNMLPRLLYLFQGLPIPVSKTLFVELKKMMTTFIWQNKRARLPYRLLICPRSRGGLSLPDFFKAIIEQPKSGWSRNGRCKILINNGFTWSTSSRVARYGISPGKTNLIGLLTPILVLLSPLLFELGTSLLTNFT